MIDYSVHMVARQEHELMQRSLAPVSDDVVPNNVRQGGWTASQVAHLLGSVGNALTALGKRIGDDHRSISDAPFQSQLEQQPGFE